MQGADLTSSLDIRVKTEESRIYGHCKSKINYELKYISLGVLYSVVSTFPSNWIKCGFLQPKEMVTPGNTL